ncbi:MAG: hypothetical protein Q4B06_01080 [Candidatus Saccharibacteria bacterium]|nr:hypothetical protein [Candidatus Saccharibacteria bacterium]
MTMTIQAAISRGWMTELILLGEWMKYSATSYSLMLSFRRGNLRNIRWRIQNWTTAVARMMSSTEVRSCPVGSLP